MTLTRIRSTLERILEDHYVGWILLGFSISYLLFFLAPVFLSSNSMQYFNYVMPADRTASIGFDLAHMLSYSRAWLVEHSTPYIGNNLYPPLASVLFAVLLGLPFRSAYTAITLFSVAGYVVLVFALPRWALGKQNISGVHMLIFITGLFSYGLQVELERGQFNIIAVLLAFLAIWIFHYNNRYRAAAYVLFSIAVQLKVYPLIFILMLISDWRDWRGNLKRLGLLALANFALLFILGPGVFLDFVNAIQAQIQQPYIGIDNHSIRSFVTLVAEYAARRGSQWVTQYSGLIQATLLAMVLICLLLVLLKAYREGQSDLNPYLLLACTIAASLIPPVSFDYKLSILAAPVAVLFANERMRAKASSRPLQLTRVLAILVFFAAYSSTLLSFTNRPHLLDNSCPALLIMLLGVTWLYLMTETSSQEQKPGTPMITQSPEGAKVG